MTSSRDSILAARGTALVAAGVCLFVIALLVLTLRQDRALSPIISPELATLKEQLTERPNDAQLKSHIRDRDRDLRRDYFARQQFLARGGWLLIAAGGALVLSLKSLSTLTSQPTLPAPERTDTYRQAQLARLGVAASGVILLGVCGALALSVRPNLPEPPQEAAAALPLPSAAQLEANWVNFRGPSGCGLVGGTIPESWDGPASKNILWKSAVPLPGHASPIVYDGRVFLSASDGNLQEIMAFDAKTGAQVFRTSVPRGTLQNPNVFDDTGFAAPTPVTDGVRVYALFATGDLGAVSINGKRLWARNLGAIESHYGLAGSLAVHEGKIIVQWDQGDAEQNKSFLLCLDGATGKQLWKTPRPVGNSWASPIIANGVIYTSGLPYVIAYNASDGKEIWRAKLMDGDVAASPVFRDGVVYVANDRALAAAIRADGAGDVTESHVKWKQSELQLPDIVSPLTDGERLLIVTSAGDMTCLEAATGKTLWTHSLGVMVNASPLLAGKEVYLTDHEGLTHVFQLSTPQFQELRSSPLGEQVTASPAAVAGRLYIRAKENLYCVGVPTP